MLIVSRIAHTNIKDTDKMFKGKDFIKEALSKVPAFLLLNRSKLEETLAKSSMLR